MLPVKSQAAASEMVGSPGRGLFRLPGAGSSDDDLKEKLLPDNQEVSASELLKESPASEEEVVQVPESKVEVSLAIESKAHTKRLWKLRQKELNPEIDVVRIEDTKL